MREKAAVVERCISPSKRTWRRRSYALPSWLKLSAGRGWDAFLDALHGRSASWGEDVEDVRAGAWSLIRATCCWSLWGDLGSNGQSCTRCCRSTAGSCPASCAEGSGCDEPGFGHPIWTHVLHLYVLSTSFHVYFMRISTHVAHCHAAGFTIDLHRPSTICGMCRSGWATSCQMKRTNWTQQVKTWPSWNRSHGSILHNACCMNLSSKSTGSTNGLELPRKCFSWFGVTQDLFSLHVICARKCPESLNHWITSCWNSMHQLSGHQGAQQAQVVWNSGPVAACGCFRHCRHRALCGGRASWCSSWGMLLLSAGLSTGMEMAFSGGTLDCKWFQLKQPGLFEHTRLDNYRAGVQMFCARVQPAKLWRKESINLCVQALRRLITRISLQDPIIIEPRWTKQLAFGLT